MSSNTITVDLYKKDVITDPEDYRLKGEYPYCVILSITEFTDKDDNVLYQFDIVDIEGIQYIIDWGNSRETSHLWYIYDKSDKSIAALQDIDKNKITRIGFNHVIEFIPLFFSKRMNDAMGFKILHIYVTSENRWYSFSLTEERLKKLTDRQKKVIEIIRASDDGKINGGYEIKPYFEVETLTDSNVFQALSVYADKLGYK